VVGGVPAAPARRDAEDPHVGTAELVLVRGVHRLDEEPERVPESARPLHEELVLARADHVALQAILLGALREQILVEIPAVEALAVEDSEHRVGVAEHERVGQGRSLLAEGRVVDRASLDRERRRRARRPGRRRGSRCGRARGGCESADPRDARADRAGVVPQAASEAITSPSTRSRRIDRRYGASRAARFPGSGHLR